MSIVSTYIQFLFILFIVKQETFGYIQDKPEFLRTCRKKDKEFIKCSTNAVQGLFDKIKDGIPEINLPPTEPLYIDRINILQGDGPVSVNASLRNVTVHGFGKTEVMFNSVDPRNYDFLTKIFIPVMRIEGVYDLIGRILVLPMRGKGHCWFEPSNMTMNVKSDVELYERDNFHFYNVTAVHVNFKIGGLKLYMGNLFDGLKALEKSTNEFLNENWRPAAESLYGVLGKAIEDILLKIMQNIFDNIPADYWVSDIAEPV